MNGGEMTSGELVRAFRSDPTRRDLVRDCYWDEDVLAAAERFRASEEYEAVRELLRRWLPRRRLRVLDLGAGVGVSSYAFARDGHEVIAVEPDPSEVVGRGACLRMVREAGLPVRCIEGVGEALPAEAAGVDLVYTRQVLHHASDLPVMAGEAFRVLRPGGFLLATREHVLSRPEHLDLFLQSHLTHGYLGNEHAYTLEAYLEAFAAAGFSIRRALGPRSSAINRFPMSNEAHRRELESALARRVGQVAARWLVRSAPLRRAYEARRDRHDSTPGRMYSFLAQRPPA